jgi:gas vesicle protein
MKKFKRYEGGGEVMGEMDPMEAAAKKRGLEMSNKEAPVGFFERLRAGNIDQPGSEAYNRFGAGRGRDRGESVSVNQPMPAAPAAPAASSRPLSDDMYSDYGSSTGAGAAGTSETIKPTRQVMTKPTLPAKPTATPVPPLRNTGPDRSSLINKPSLNTNYSNEGRNKPAPAAPTKPSMDIPAMRDNAKAALADDPSALMMGGGAAAAAAALLARSKLGKMFKGAKKAAEKSPYLKELGTNPPKKLLEGPRTATKSSDVTDVVPKSTSYRSLTGKAREDARANEARDKLMKSDFVKKPKKGLDESDTTGGAIGYKRGGKMKKYASGGMVSSASKRADGIATKGKTRCKIC